MTGCLYNHVAPMGLILFLVRCNYYFAPTGLKKMYLAPADGGVPPW